MGNIYLQQHEIEKAKEKYLEAIALQVPVVVSCYFPDTNADIALCCLAQPCRGSLSTWKDFARPE